MASSTELANQGERRQINQALYEKLLVGHEGVEGTQPTGLLEGILQIPTDTQNSPSRSQDQGQNRRPKSAATVSLAEQIRTEAAQRTGRETKKNPDHGHGQGSNYGVVVELLISYSNRGGIRWDRLCQLVAAVGEPLEEPVELLARSRQRHVRLGALQRAALVEGYAAGETLVCLSVAFGVSRETVRRVLDEAGVVRRYRVWDRLDLDVIQRRYQSGESLATIGRELGVDAKTIRRAMLAAGIPTRPRAGR